LRWLRRAESLAAFARKNDGAVTFSDIFGVHEIINQCTNTMLLTEPQSKQHDLLSALTHFSMFCQLTEAQHFYVREVRAAVDSIPPNLESKSGATSFSVGLWFAQFLTQVFPSIFGFFPLKKKVLLIV